MKCIHRQEFKIDGKSCGVFEIDTSTISKIYTNKFQIQIISSSNLHPFWVMGEGLWQDIIGIAGYKYNLLYLDKMPEKLYIVLMRKPIKMKFTLLILV